MTVKALQIRYQTARSLPAPYAYFYTFSAKWLANKGVQVDIAMTYPGREDIDDDELIAEGYTRDDDFNWSGQFPQAWAQTLSALAAQTRLNPVRDDTLGEDDDFWELTIDQISGPSRFGRPAEKGKGSTSDWQYLTQELIQAIYEAQGRERPFELAFRDIRQQDQFDLTLTASFVERSVQVATTHNQRKQTKTLPWSELQRIMGIVYSYDYEADDTLTKAPRQDGQWLNLGTEEWYDVQPMRELGNLFKKL
ncbi:hypothetical protein [Spirosoma sp. KUDC1026]|uniref:hypothetical protein n=1 Tax=Spirosoma sp. KUDC1026 TaxID=2745947 RepID=UPI00159BB811|nr:hypothetical protein [Spirosoma sp. KUDC1026]QKZ13754.1 hypothetical protein HU175_14380 [Spirosoma sp. KUDC1026]